MDDIIGRVSDFENNYENPFGAELITRMKIGLERVEIGTKAISMLDESSGEVTRGEVLFMSEQEEVDRSTFLKVYIGQLDLFFNFSKTAEKVLKYFIMVLKRNADQVGFDMIECIRISGLKGKSSVYRGIGELLVKRIIAKGPNEYIYYINPSIIFNGNRMVFVKQILNKDYKQNNEL